MSAGLFDPDEFADAVKAISKIVQSTAPTEPDKPLPLGTRVLFSHPLTRRYLPGSPARKVWEPPLYAEDANRKHQGVVVGVRTLSDGRTHWNGEDEPISYTPDEHFTAYLIAYDLHRKPVHVRPEHVHPELTTV